MKIHESGENYLETILILKNKNGFVRSIDIANMLGFSKPSVSRAVSTLKQNDLIVVGKDNLIELTDSGREIAEKMLERHRLLSSYLIALGVSEEVAFEDACRMEHVISSETFEKIKAHIKNKI